MKMTSVFSSTLPFFIAALMTVTPQIAFAEIIDPEQHILKNGYHSKSIGDDGKTVFYNFTERAIPARISNIEADIEKLPKHQEVFKVCDFMRGGVKAKLIEERGIAYDVALTNYGYSGKTIACALKYMLGSKVGTQLIFSKSTATGMYMVYVTT